MRWEATMRGLMSERPLLISGIIAHAALYHADTEVVTRTVEGPIHRYTYADAERRAKRLARALLQLGVGPGDRVGTLAWNTHRHFELYYGVSGIGAVCHTINPRLFDEQIVVHRQSCRRPAAVCRDFVHPAGRAPLAVIAQGVSDRAPRRSGDAAAGAGDIRRTDRRRERGFRRGPSSTSGMPPRCATPRARPATRKARSTAIARR